MVDLIDDIAFSGINFNVKKGIKEIKMSNGFGAVYVAVASEISWPGSNPVIGNLRWAVRQLLLTVFNEYKENRCFLGMATFRLNIFYIFNGLIACLFFFIFVF